MRRLQILRLACSTVVLAVCLLASGCGGEGGSVGGGPAGGGIDPPGTEIGGEWATWSTETNDTCGFDAMAPYAPLLVEDHGDSVMFTFADGFGGCEQSVRLRSGDTVTLTRSDTIDGGCGIVRIQSSYVYHFSESALTGAVTHQYSVLDGACSNLPCTYQLSVTGSRCDHCWPGCAELTDASSAGPRPRPGAVAAPAAER
jgi:hypothetical protein